VAAIKAQTERLEREIEVRFYRRNS
jgi:hypothetical protein